VRASASCLFFLSFLKNKRNKTHVRTMTGPALLTVVKIVCLALLVPAVAVLPYGLSRVCVFVERGPAHLLLYVWAAYAVLEAGAVLWYRRGRHTLESWTTQHAVHIIFSLGAFHFLSVAQRVPVPQRRDAVWVWLTLTMLANLAFSYADATDHAAKAREEVEKQRRKEERRK
jgi:hypothetical protein